MLVLVSNHDLPRFSCLMKMFKMLELNVEDFMVVGFYFLSVTFLDFAVLRYLLTVNAEPSCVSVDDGSSHSQASPEATSISGAHTVCRTYSAVFSFHINHAAATVLLFYSVRVLGWWMLMFVKLDRRLSCVNNGLLI